MNILLLGSGGRECAISWKLAQSDQCRQLYIAPGNAGTSAYGTNISLAVTDFEGIKAFCTEQKIDLVIPGGEDALVAGIYDFFKNDEALKHIIVAGPSKEGAQLEGSKAFSKKFMQRHQIPTAAYREFDNNSFEDGLLYLESHSLPIVLKADGLAAGKGVVITEDIAEAKQVFTAMIKEAQFGDAGKKVVIEQFLSGVEVSVFILTDGKHYILLPEAKDYKRIGEGDKGPNTGGMGAVSPVPFATDTFMAKVKDRIIDPTVQGLLSEGIVYQGFIFFGLINVGGEPYVIEYNCRMGDPETEVVMPRLDTDLVTLFRKMDEGKLNEVFAPFVSEAACTIMMVSEGYPGNYEKGKLISGLNETENCLVFHAGTQLKDSGEVYTNGGRVLAVTAYGDNMASALQNAYTNVQKVHFEGKYYRSDIGFEF